ncbi:MAG TPA: hypothetical protein VGP93_06895, partial [Polyangiaceae bacterium]|nr:hypothetical protein [Polyangiaceae bacterium]
ERTAMDLELGLELSPTKEGFRPPIVLTVATSGRGLEGLVSALDAHRAWLATAAGKERSKVRERGEIERALRADLGERLLRELGEPLEAMIDRVQAGEIDPYSAVDELLASRDQR